MQKSKWRIGFLLLSGFILINSACAQNPPFLGKAYVDEKKLVEQSTVLLNNSANIIPLQNLGRLKIASVHFSYTYASGFDSLLNKYDKVTPFNGNEYSGAKSLDDLSYDLKWYNTIIIQLTGADLNDPQLEEFIRYNQRIKTVIIALFGDSNTLLRLNDQPVPVIWSQRMSPVSAFFCAQAIFGGVAITQKLTNTLSGSYKKGMGFTTVKTRLEYSVPEDAGIKTDNLQEIDNIAAEALQNQATPGCVVLVAPKRVR